MDGRCQAITVLEAWDYMRDVMTLILYQQFLEDDEVIALLIIPSISSALETIILRLEAGPSKCSLCRNINFILPHTIQGNLSLHPHGHRIFKDLWESYRLFLRRVTTQIF